MRSMLLLLLVLFSPMLLAQHEPRVPRRGERDGAMRHERLGELRERMRERMEARVQELREMRDRRRPEAAEQERGRPADGMRRERLDRARQTPAPGGRPGQRRRDDDREPMHRLRRLRERLRSLRMERTGREQGSRERPQRPPHRAGPGDDRRHRRDV